MSQNWGNNNGFGAGSASGFGGSPSSFGFGNGGSTPPPKPRQSSLRRSSPNWFSAACGLLFIVVFLFLPFVKLASLIPVSGSFFIDINPVMIIPVLLGVMMLLASLLFSPIISAFVGGAAAVTVFVLVLSSMSILIKGEVGKLLASVIGSVVNNLSSLDVMNNLVVSIGLGGVLCIVLCVVFVVLELFLSDGIRPAPSVPSDNPWPSA